MPLTNKQKRNTYPYVARKLETYTRLINSADFDNNLMFQSSGFDVYDQSIADGFAMVAVLEGTMEARIVYEFKELSPAVYEIFGTWTHPEHIGQRLVEVLSEQVAKNRAEATGTSTWITPMPNAGGAKSGKHMNEAYASVDGYTVEISWTTKEESPDNLRALIADDDFWNDESQWKDKIFHMKWIKD